MNIKTPRELDIMRKAGAIVANALCLAQQHIRPGITTLEICKIIEDYIYSKDAYPTFKGYRGFPAGACISLNQEVVHGIPGSRKLCEGDIVGIDIGAKHAGYHADAARTFPVGEVDAEALRLIDVTKKSFFEGIRRARAGARLGDIGNAIQTYAEAEGFSVVRDLVGHGIGTNLHEPPDVPNFGPGGRGVRLVAGMTLAVEPMINAGTYEVKVLRDGWTTVTADGKNSAHYENTIIVTDGEAEIITL